MGIFMLNYRFPYIMRTGYTVNTACKQDVAVNAYRSLARRYGTVGIVAMRAAIWMSPEGLQLNFSWV